MDSLDYNEPMLDNIFRVWYSLYGLGWHTLAEARLRLVRHRQQNQCLDNSPNPYYILIFPVGDKENT
ncbi:hypothetical protein LCGC14_0902460 [marine sediment metagenome]|uniref:Uncharacterized protein n=1 Tax=marine sediment metagenome TaxID=412755 RepID=A0A0F9PGQ9_9ZZZZ